MKGIFEKLTHLRLYAANSFIDAYRKQTDVRVAKDPHSAVGGMWEELGELQISFLRGQGLQPEDKLLDLGCGTLRAGRHLIGYLDAGNYTGVDVSPKALAFARELVEAEGLAGKSPKLILNEDGNLRFEGLGGTYDVILAQSVFTHLPENFIVECFDNLHKILEGTFYFTIFPGAATRRKKLKTFCYPIDWIRELAETRGYRFANHATDYDHPRGQVMLAVSRR